MRDIEAAGEYFFDYSNFLSFVHEHPEKEHEALRDYIWCKSADDGDESTPSEYEVVPFKWHRNRPYTPFKEYQIKLTSCRIHVPCTYEVLDGTTLIEEGTKDSPVFRCKNPDIKYSVVLPNTVNRIPDFCFTNSGLQSINLANISYVGEDAFLGCNSIKELQGVGYVEFDFCLSGLLRCKNLHDIYDLEANSPSFIDMGRARLRSFWEDELRISEEVLAEDPNPFTEEIVIHSCRYDMDDLVALIQRHAKWLQNDYGEDVVKITASEDGKRYEFEVQPIKGYKLTKIIIVDYNAELESAKSETSLFD